MTQNSPNTHSVNKPSLLASLFKKKQIIKKKTKARGFVLLALTLYGCLHVQHLSFLCMLLLELFSCSPFLYIFMFFMCIHFNLSLEVFFFVFNLDLICCPFISFFDYCVHTVTVQCILLTRSLKEGPCWQSGRSLKPAGWVLSERKIKTIPFIIRFPLFLLWETRAHRMDSWVRSATTEQDNHLQCIPLWCYCEQLQC